jgi:hypothetical protein
MRERISRNGMITTEPLPICGAAGATAYGNGGKIYHKNIVSAKFRCYTRAVGQDEVHLDYPLAISLLPILGGYDLNLIFRSCTQDCIRLHKVQSIRHRRGSCCEC